MGSRTNVVCRLGMIRNCLTRLIAPAAALALVLILCGCTTRLERVQERLGTLEDPRLNEVVQRNIAATGGMEKWLSVVSLKGEVIATLFDAQRSETLVEQEHKISIEIPTEPTLVTIVSKEPGGKLYEHLNQHGYVISKWSGAKGRTGRKNDIDSFAAGLKLLLEGQAITGCASALREGLTLNYLGENHQGGRFYHKIEISGRLLAQKAPPTLWQKVKGTFRRQKETRLDDKMVLWISNQTSLVERIWLQYQKPYSPQEFGYVAVQVTDYTKLPSGLIVPRRLEFVPSDANQHFSRLHIVIAEVQQWLLKEKPAGKKHTWLKLGL